MTSRPIAYIRRSSGKESPASWETQRDAVLRAAEARGDSLTNVETLPEAQGHPDYFVDWGLSGADPTRAAFLGMVAEVEAGRVSTVYVYHSDRLARHTATLAALLDTAEDAGIAIVDGSGQDLAAEDYRVAAEVTGSVSAGEYRNARRRNRARTERQRARGDQFGQPPYGYRRVERTNTRNEPLRFERVPGHPLETVLETVRRNGGNLLRSARVLNAAGIPAPRGGSWGTATLVGLVAREAPGLRPPGERRGRPPARPRYFSRLLRCHCGRFMSPSGAGKADHWTCRSGHRDPRHPRPYNVSEPVILEWAKAEAGRLRVPDRVEVEAPDERRRELDSRLERLSRQHEMGIIDDATLQARAAEVLDAAERLMAATVVVDVPAAIEWDTDPPEAVNGVLRTMWRHVQLGTDLRPLEADWRVPQWRA